MSITHQYLRALASNITDLAVSNSTAFEANITDYSSNTSSYSNYTAHSPNATYYTDESDSSSMNDAQNDGSIIAGMPMANGLVVLWVLLLVGCCVCATLCPNAGSDDAEQNQSNDNNRHRTRPRRNTTTRKRSRYANPVIRKALIEHSLTVMQVNHVDENTGDLVLGESQAVRRDCSLDHPHPVHENEEEDTTTCVICLSPFEVGDEVAWSRPKHMHHDPLCRHVFHHDCILEWLMSKTSHDDCPSCRTVLLHYDEEEEDTFFTDDSVGDEQNPEGDVENGGMFVIVDGLVKKVRRASLILMGKSSQALDPNCVGKNCDGDNTTLNKEPQKRMQSSTREMVWSKAYPSIPANDCKAVTASDGIGSRRDSVLTVSRNNCRNSRSHSSRTTRQPQFSDQSDHRRVVSAVPALPTIIAEEDSRSINDSEIVTTTDIDPVGESDAIGMVEIPLGDDDCQHDCQR